MSSFFYQIVDDACNYDDKEEMARLYAIKLINLRVWVEECLDSAEIPDGFFRRAFICDFFAGDSGKPYELWRYIQNRCLPDVGEEETCVKCFLTKTEVWSYNTTPVKNAPVCSDCLNTEETEKKVNLTVGA